MVKRTKQLRDWEKTVESSPINALIYGPKGDKSLVVFDGLIWNKKEKRYENIMKGPTPNPAVHNIHYYTPTELTFLNNTSVEMYVKEEGVERVIFCLEKY